jgi:hypothetical protein
MQHNGLMKGHESPPFPYRQLAILGKHEQVTLEREERAYLTWCTAICRICEPIAFMSIFPYIYVLIESFNITDNSNQITFYGGMVTSAFALAEAMSSSIWGRLSDKFGRKPILLCGLAGTGISMVAFGFATTFPALLIARALGGLLNGNIGVLQTTVAEVVTVEEHQSFAFAIMPAVWSIGSIIGYALGGGLADPVKAYPGLFQPDTVFARHPYLLPNMVCGFVVIISMTVGLLFLEETHEDKQGRKDLGLEAGKRILRICGMAKSEQGSTRSITDASETTSLLQHEDELPNYLSAEERAIGSPPPYQSLGSNPPLSYDAEISQSTNGDRTDFTDISNASSNRKGGVWESLTGQVMLNIVGYGIIA